MRQAAQVVRSWYAVHRNNDEHPFTIPDKSLRALVALVQVEIDGLQAQVCELYDQLQEREAEQLSAPTHEEEG